MLETVDIIGLSASQAENMLALSGWKVKTVTPEKEKIRRDELKQIMANLGYSEETAGTFGFDKSGWNVSLVDTFYWEPTVILTVWSNIVVDADFHQSIDNWS